MMILRRLFILPIRFYRYFISPLFPPSCRFTPTCSQYAIESIEEFGILKGGFLAIKRISKCHPWHNPN
jgi:putative membrane protein insertion efficiency factor